MGFSGAAIFGAITAATAGASLGYQISETESGKEEAAKRRAEQERKAAEMGAAADKRAAEEEGLEASTNARDTARRRQRALSAGFKGRSSTILTSPLGITGEADPEYDPAAEAATTGGAAGKTVLGA